MYYFESSLQQENRDEMKTSTNHLDNLDFITRDNLSTNPFDNLETSNKCLSDGNTVDNREECLSDGNIRDNKEECPSDGLEFLFDDNQNQLEVPSVSHDVPVNQLSSSANSIIKSHENTKSEPYLKNLPNRVTRGKPKVSYEPVLNSKSRYPINNYVFYHRLSKKSMAFMNQLYIYIPNNMQEALKDFRWREAMNEEMKAF
jgi:hypothetical protein